MTFEHLKLAAAGNFGVFLIEGWPVEDDRGAFTRIFCEHEFEPLKFRTVQANLSYTHRRGTLRGLHYQSGLAKIIYVLQGSIVDAVLHPVTGRKVQAELEPCNGIYVPAGFAHGFQTITDRVLLLYLYSDLYDPTTERGLHYTSGDLGWPVEPPTLVSSRDASFTRKSWT